MLQQAYDDREMKNSQVYDWHKHFCDGHESVDSDLCSGRPSMSSNEANVECVWEIVRSDGRVSVDQIAPGSGISVESCHSILHDVLNMHRVCLHLMPWMLTRKKKGMHVNISGALIDMADKDNKSFNNVITGNETWCFLYNARAKQHSSEWKSLSSPQSKKFWVHMGDGKVMLDFLFPRALSVMSLSLNAKLWIKKCTLISFITLGILSEGNSVKNGEWTVGSCLWQCPSTPFVCGQGFLRKEQCDNTGASSILSWPGCIWFLPVHLTEIDIEGMVLLWCNRHHRECERGTGKALTRWLPGRFPKPL